MSKRNEPVWDDSNAIRKSISERNIPVSEQEATINYYRSDNYIDLTCSHNVLITKLKKNPLFKVTAITFNSLGNLIVQVDGILPEECLSFRKSKYQPNLSQKERQNRRNRITKFHKDSKGDLHETIHKQDMPDKSGI